MIGCPQKSRLKTSGPLRKTNNSSLLLLCDKAGQQGFGLMGRINKSYNGFFFILAKFWKCQKVFDNCTETFAFLGSPDVSLVYRNSFVDLARVLEVDTNKSKVKSRSRNRME
ncbi:hypothetical protein TNCT_373081 [Trichonephila clavata]|uniref:Uncharacterized protein n=1 Tax=Trichonephila clavata TaxID=2740835 RepID=A0A8X6M485_TRICU|nr:hypothetical protein TNCT_373081 [Trichonephila clavata]